MKNLKKLLALVLVVVMAMGLMTFASAAATDWDEYLDKDAITQDEAVDLLTALGIFQGDDTGNFGPQATFTRAAVGTCDKELF